MDRSVYMSLRRELAGRPWNKTWWVPWLEQIVLLSVIVGLGKLSWWGAVVASPLLAVFFFRSFSLMHECVHNCGSPHRSINRLLGHFAGWFCFLPYEQWKAVHLDHHYWSGNVERDSVLALVREIPQWKYRYQKAINLLWRSWIPAIAGLQQTVFWVLCFQKMKLGGPQRSHWIGVVTQVVVMACAAFLTPVEFLLGAVLPALLIYFMLIEFVNFPHHLELPQVYGEKRLMAWEQDQAARSCIYPGWFAQNVVLNFNYHVEHHLFPDLPANALPEIHNKLRPLLGKGYNLDGQFAWVLRNRKRDLTEILLSTRGSEFLDASESVDIFPHLKNSGLRRGDESSQVS